MVCPDVGEEDEMKVENVNALKNIRAEERVKSDTVVVGTRSFSASAAVSKNSIMDSGEHIS